jgi:hypothetical protein
MHISVDGKGQSDPFLQSIGRFFNPELMESFNNAVLIVEWRNLYLKHIRSALKGFQGDIKDKKVQSLVLATFELRTAKNANPFVKKVFQHFFLFALSEIALEPSGLITSGHVLLLSSNPNG